MLLLKLNGGSKIMKAISIILSSILCAGAPLVAAEKEGQPVETVQQVNSYQLGSEVVEKIRADYQAGAYAEFLKEMDQAYKTAKTENQLEGLIEIRKESALSDQYQEQFIKGYDSIQKERNKELLNAIAKEQDSILVQKIRVVASTPETFSKTLIDLRMKAPGTGKNSDENTLIEIDLENYYKTIHLDSLAANRHSVPDRTEKHLVLDMQRMEQMVAASKNFQDKELKATVEKASSTQDVRLARVYDLNDLTALAKGKIKPVTPLEEKTASILAGSQDKVADLHQEIFRASHVVQS